MRDRYRGATPLDAVARGIVAGVVGTAAMTLWQELAGRLRSGHPEEGSERGSEDPWQNAPAPAKVARRVLEGVFGQQVPAERIGFLTNAMHWAYGTAWGAAYGVVQGRIRANPLAHGLAFGGGVWAMSYVQLVPMGLYEPPWKYPPKELALDLSYHLVYGAGVAAAYAALDEALES